jgi:hypothetical protein
MAIGGAGPLFYDVPDKKTRLHASCHSPKILKTPPAVPA